MTDATGTRRDFRVGDVLSLACPRTPTRVERGVKWGHISVRWPWWDIDPDSRSVRWNSVVGLGVGDEHGEAVPKLFGPIRRPSTSRRVTPAGSAYRRPWCT